MSKITNVMENKIMPFSQKLSTNKFVIALRDGLTLSMPLLIVGSVAIIIGDFPVQAFQDFMFNWIGDFWYVWCWDIVVPATIGLIGLLSVVGVSHSLAKENKVEPLPAVAIALACYFILLHQVDGSYPGSSFDAQGLFTGMLTAIISTSIYTFILKKNWVIKMPESVPSFVARQFTAITPAAATIVLFLIVRIVVGFTSFETVNNLVIEVLQKPLVNVGTTLIGTLTVSFVNSVLWFFGIHGTAIVDSVMQPLWYAARFENLEVFQAGADAVRPYIVTQDFANHLIFLGGTGNTLALAILMAFRCKSNRIRSLGRLSVLPGLFNVNEPIIFGLPLVLNPVMAIPFFLVPVATVLISYFAMSTGLVPLTTGVTVPWTTPAPIGGWLMCNDIRGGILQLVVIAVAGLIYYPFITALDKQYLKEEAAAA